MDEIKELEERVERLEHEQKALQKQVLKLAFGWGHSYQTMCQIQDIRTLEERRIECIDRFIAKSVNNDRFKESWFPLRTIEGPDVRGRRVFKETCARTSRYYNSPLAFMRRRANDILTS